MDLYLYPCALSATWFVSIFTKISVTDRRMNERNCLKLSTGSKPPCMIISKRLLMVPTRKRWVLLWHPRGTRKTIMGLRIVANKKQPALIIIHRKQLFNQWVERIQSFLGIAESFIGKISSGQQKVGTHITVAMIQSLAVIDPANDLFNSFGLIIVDECHLVSARNYAGSALCCQPIGVSWWHA